MARRKKREPTDAERREAEARWLRERIWRALIRNEAAARRRRHEETAALNEGKE